MKLDDTQTTALDALTKRLVEAAQRVVSAKKASRQDPSEVLIEDEFSNTFGVLGPRGAGKSTILHCLHERNGFGEQGFQEGLIVLKPFDCSLVGPDLAPGAAILLHLEQELNNLLVGQGREHDSDSKKIFAKLHGLAGQYAQATEGFRSLGAELSSSLEAYTDFILRGMRQRMSLRQHLDARVEECLAALNRGLKLRGNVFVVLLDDFDLVHAREVRKWILALLDELHQRRLLIVVTADFYRLEHLSWDPEAEFDDMTGRAVLDKLLPSPNRVSLKRWLRGAREEFESSEEKRKLGSEIQRFDCGSVAQRAVLKRLLPGWPRGLVNLSRSLEGKADAPNFEVAPGKPLKEDVQREFVSLLASCRGEPLLARELSAKPASFWPRYLPFQEETAPEDWSECVEVAMTRFQEKRSELIESSQQLKAIRLLLPREASNLKPRIWKNGAGKVGGTGIETRALEYEGGTGSAYDALRHDPAWRDPLRHDYLRIQHLRDAQESVQPFWAELLLNYGFLNRDDELRNEAIWNRLYFLDRWQPAASKAKGAELRVQCDRESLRRFFEAEGAPWATLFWMSWEAGKEPVVSIGWHALVSALRGSRDVFQAEQMADLLVDLRKLKGELPKVGQAKELSFIPDHVWSMVLLVDSLDRCPWRLFSRPLGWQLSTYVYLATVFVRSAYVHALRRCGILQGSLSKAQHVFVHALDRRGPVELLQLQEEEMVNRCRAVLLDSFEERINKKSDSLSAAAAEFFHSPVYKGIKEMFAETREA